MVFLKKMLFLFMIAVLPLALALPASAGQLDASDARRIEDALADSGVSDFQIDLNCRVPVADTPDQPAVDLWATVIRKGEAPKPTILVATPYRREIMMLLYVSLVQHDYNLMAVDIRGTGSSEGQWVSFGPEEHLDVARVVDEWIPGQSWSDGRVGMIGPSYMGIIQLLAAGRIERGADGEPAHLKALFPMVAMSDAYRDIVMHGGNLDLEFIPMWLGMVDIMALLPPILGEDGFSQDKLSEKISVCKSHLRQIPVHLDWIMDPAQASKNDFYETKSPMIYWPEKPAGGWDFPDFQWFSGGSGEGMPSIPADLPAFMTAGWFDIFTRGSLNNYQYGLKNHDKADKSLIIGPWYHLGGSMGLGVDSLLNGDLAARWFDWKIKGIADPFMTEYPVLMYVDGAARWRAEKAWPLPESRVEEETLYLSKQKASKIGGDAFSTLNAKNNYKLVDEADFDDYNGLFWGLWPYELQNPELEHDPRSLHGLVSRSATRWLMGLPALVSQASKFFLDKDIDAAMPYEDERLDELGVLTFTTEPLEEDTEICGPLTLKFRARTDFQEELYQWQVDQVLERIQERFEIDDMLVLDLMDKDDVQWVVELNDVYPGGRARNVTSGWLSAWQRPYDPADPQEIDPAYLADPLDPFYDNGNKNPDPISEEELYAYVVELWPTANVFKKGHRIRVSISASDFPHLLPVLRPSQNEIVINEDHPAQLSFKTVKTDGRGEDWKWVEDVDAYLMD